MSTFFKIIQTTFRRFIVLFAALFLSAVVFLLLPVLQAVNAADAPDMEIIDVSSVNIPPPPPPVEEEEPEPEPEEEPPPPPQMDVDVPPLSLDQLELALNPGYGSAMGGDFSIDLGTTLVTEDSADQLFSIADLDQQPSVIFRQMPKMTQKLRKRTPATVYIIFTVDTSGRVEEAKIQRSSDPSFDRPALAALKKWKFEPGKRSGKAVKFRMRVPITFPKDS